MPLQAIKYQQQARLKADISSLYLEAFPENERPPLDYFFKSLERKENRLFAYYEKDVFIGFSFLTIYQDVCYIFFLAVNKMYRHQGYGGQILELIKKEYQDYILLLCYEEVDHHYPNYLERLARERFYQSHGFQNNQLKTDEYGVIFQTAFIGSHQVDFLTYLEIFKLGFGKGNEKYIKEVIPHQ